METIIHTIESVYDARSRVLILGTMPSPKSREFGFYYSHPQNRFWPVIAQVLGQPVPVTTNEKRALLLRSRIAMWDVLHSCDIKGADDASIANPVPNDLHVIFSAANIHAVFTTGSTATRLYKKYCLPQTGMEPIALPSTSPANCRFHTLETLTEAYRVILNYLP